MTDTRPPSEHLAADVEPAEKPIWTIAHEALVEALQFSNTGDYSTAGAILEAARERLVGIGIDSQDPRMEHSLDVLKAGFYYKAGVAAVVSAKAEREAQIKPLPEAAVAIYRPALKAKFEAVIDQDREEQSKEALCLAISHFREAAYFARMAYDTVRQWERPDQEVDDFSALPPDQRAIVCRERTPLLLFQAEASLREMAVTRMCARDRITESSKAGSILEMVDNYRRLVVGDQLQTTLTSEEDHRLTLVTDRALIVLARLHVENHYWADAAYVLSALSGNEVDLPESRPR